jgi:hypothetical protein
MNRWPGEAVYGKVFAARQRDGGRFRVFSQNILRL